MNAPTETVSPSSKINKSSSVFTNEYTNSRKQIQGSKSVKNLNFIPIELAGVFQEGKEIKTTREPRKKIMQSVSLLRLNPNERPQALSSRLNSTPSMPKEIKDFSLYDQMKMLNDIFPNEMKKNCNKICCNENRSKFYCAICKSEVKYSESSSSNSDYLFFGGCYYHLKCMRCTSCSVNLQPPFYIEKSSKIYCSYCWFNRKAKNS